MDDPSYLIKRASKARARRFTASDDSCIEQLRIDRQSVAKIAAQFGVAPETVRRRLVRMAEDQEALLE